MQGRRYLTVRGDSDLTWHGFRWGESSQGDHSTGYGRFVLEESRWKRLVPQTDWLTRRSWSEVRNRCWGDDMQGPPPPSSVFRSKRPLTIDQLQQVVAEFFGVNTEDLKKFGRRHPSTVIYAYEQIEEYLRGENKLQEISNPSDTVH